MPAVFDDRPADGRCEIISAIVRKLNGPCQEYLHMALRKQAFRGSENRKV